MPKSQDFYSLALVWTLAVSLLALPADGRAEEPVGYPITGSAVAGMEGFERQFSKLLQAHSIPGASLAIAKNGRLVYARGFGWADLESREPVEPESLFRIASISKSFTAIATLKLCQEGKLNLDQKAFDLLKDLKPCTRGSVDPRIRQITVRHLLNMTAGWDRRRSGDPIFPPAIGAVSNWSNSMRPESKSLIRYELVQRLDFKPGDGYAYGNFAYVVLGEVIERVSHQSYGKYVDKAVLEPLELHHTRLGRTRQRLKGEVKYYGYWTGKSLYPNQIGLVPDVYGAGFCLEAAQASIGWISSSIDLVRFITSVIGERPVDPPLSAESFGTMLTIPLPAADYYASEYPGEFFTMGWEVDPKSAGRHVTFSRHGSLDGTMSFVMRRSDGTAWAVLFNRRPAGFLDIRSDANEMILHAVTEHRTWPPGDLFDKYK